jgi:hypothetical protein
MPVLPLIDVMILAAWTCLIVAFAEKAIHLALNTSRAVLFGMTPYDWVITASVCLLFALALAARVWVKATEPGLLRLRRPLLPRADAEVLPDFPDPRDQAALAAAQREPGDLPAPTRLVAR